MIDLASKGPIPKCNADQILISLVVVHLDGHHVAKLGKLNHPGAVGIKLVKIRSEIRAYEKLSSGSYLVDEVDQLILGRVEAHGPHGVAQLSG